MSVKVIIVVLLIGVLASLMTSMTFLIKDDSTQRRTLTALKVRVALSVTLLVVLMLSWHFGWIEPHGLIPGRPDAGH